MKNKYSFGRMINPMRTRLMGMVALGLLERVISQGGLQKVRVDLGNGEHRDMIHMLPAGFASKSKKGAQVAVNFLGGDRAYPYSVLIDDGRYRIDVDEGEAAIYNEITGVYVKTCADGKVRMNATLIVDGDVVLTGDLKADGAVKALASGVSVSLATHLHTSAAPGSPTSTPTPGT